MRRAALLAVLLASLGAPASACRLALLLALDVSSSVDAREDRLQRDGLAWALRQEDVRAAFLAGGPVALAVYEWSGKERQHPVLGWRLVGSDGALAEAAAAIAASRRIETEFPTALGYALGHAAGQFRRAPGCTAQTLDVSGDGENNDGFPPDAAYRHFPFRGVTVNALVIGGDPALAAYFEAEVIRGPGAFVESATDYGDFADAMQRKLLRELEPRAVGRLSE